MAYYNRFRGELGQTVANIAERRQTLIDSARGHEPENIDELLAASEDQEYDYELEWVDVPNPWQPAEGGTVTVRPILFLSAGNADPERTKDHSDKGVWQLGIEARLPDNEAWYMGHVTFFYDGGKPKFEPDISVNMSATDQPKVTSVPWESADAQLLVELAEGALENQP